MQIFIQISLFFFTCYRAKVQFPAKMYTRLLRPGLSKYIINTLPSLLMPIICSLAQDI